MKVKIIILSCMIMFSFSKSHAAFLKDTIPFNQTSILSDYQELSKKSHRQLLTGGLLLGGGCAMGLAGSLLALKELGHILSPDAKDYTSTINTLLYAGLGLVVIGVPFIISGVKNKKKAKLLMKNEPLGINIGRIKNRSIPSVGIRINF